MHFATYMQVAVVILAQELALLALSVELQLVTL